MILIADDDAAVVHSLTLLLKQAGYPSISASNPEQALGLIREKSPSLVLQDMNFSRNTTGEEGLDLLRKIKNLEPSPPVVLITAWGTIPLAVEGMKCGASDFITKPWTKERVVETVKTILGLAGTVSSKGPSPSRDQLDGQWDLAAIAGEDPALLRLLEVIGRVALTEASVLITGESGTGKELIAEAVHKNSRRRNGPFVKVNLGGIPASLFESEMFGHVRGAFTDARSDRRGRFETASGGTVFLDEIGELEPSSQVKLLRVLQDRTFEVLGSSVSRPMDARVVSATNRPLASLVTEGRFREDLLYRINLISVHLPPLRERPGDIPVLARRFLQTFSQIYQRDGLSIGKSGSRWLSEQPWPGNIRQLRQVLERAVLLSSRQVLEAETFLTPSGGERIDPTREVLPPVGSMTMEEIERALILKSLAHHGGNVTRAAEALGFSRPAFYRRLEKHRIEV